MRVNGTLYYTLKDHPSTTLRTSLGSASVVTDSSGNIVGEQRYYPFGETRLATGTLYTDKLFTRWIEPVEIGQRNIAGLGIYHYQSRFYSPKLGRFLSADSLVPNPFNPQDFNRYAYVRNNPVRYTDPSGHMVWDGGNEGGGCYAPNCGLPTLPPPCTRNCGGPAKPPIKPQGNGGCGGGPLGGASGGTGGEPTPPITGANLGGSQPEPSLDPNQTGGPEPCTIDGVSTTCIEIWEVEATVTNLERLETDTSNLAAETAFFAFASAFFAPPVAAYLGYESYALGTLSSFFGEAKDEAASSASQTITVSRIVSEETYFLPALTYDDGTGGSVYTPISPFTFLYIVNLEARPYP